MQADYYQAGTVIGATVAATAAHAEFVTKGTSAHMIFPVRGHILRFEVGGEVVYARYARHPGTQPNPYFENTIQRWPEFLREAAG
jgi:hypothetical protein